MSICFYHQGVLYADQFQILDYENYIKTNVDNKIFVTKNKKAVMAIMGRVPVDVNTTMERIERIASVYKQQLVNGVDAGKIVDTITTSLQQLGLDFILVIYLYSNRWIVIKSEILHSSKNKQPPNITINFKGETVSLYGTRMINVLLDGGMSPERVFHGISTFTKYVSKSYTAYDMATKKFIKTNLEG